ncbi:MAG: formyltetrahydrofolate deformylase [Verrucomicrobiales bacterium]|nr:formyltetrahydrofolate deformylase [Verrucomicrobiales bacterium]
MPPSAASLLRPAHTLLVECSDQAGLVHAITGVLFRHGANVVGNQEFVDRRAARFFMRTEFDGQLDPGRVVHEIAEVLPAGAVVRLANPGPRRIIVLATREHHCLADILIRNAYHEFNSQVLAVVSNHAHLESLVRKFDLPFHHVPHADLERVDHEARVHAVIEPYRPDYLVLAKYMRVLSPQFVRHFPDRMINIHHSFLPAFAGARPYHQAFDRGVKVIGATAHFVTEQLDEGPILVQQVIPVDHTHTAEDLQQAGRDVEQIVLARALRLVFEDRVFLCGNRTIIFD